MSRSLKVRGNQTLGALKSRLKSLPISVAHEIASSSAPGLTTRTRDAYDSFRTVYGEARPAGVGGYTLDLTRSGDTRASMQFVANGRIVRCVLGTPYAKYLIGRYKILPNGAMPVEWSRFLADLLAKSKVDKYLRVGP